MWSELDPQTRSCIDKRKYWIYCTFIFAVINRSSQQHKLQSDPNNQSSLLISCCWQTLQSWIRNLFVYTTPAPVLSHREVIKYILKIILLFRRPVKFREISMFLPFCFFPRSSSSFILILKLETVEKEEEEYRDPIISIRLTLGTMLDRTLR